jgi:hypothetical protein
MKPALGMPAVVLALLAACATAPVGADAYLFLRKSRYSAPGFNDVDQRNPQVRIFVAWNDVH